MSTTGSSADIVTRVTALIPGRWFNLSSPIRDALLGGLADSAAWLYSFIGYVRSQTRLSTAYGIFLDILSFDFLGRTLLRSGAADDAYRKVIKATILKERVTRAGMISAVTALTGIAPSIFEPWNTYDTGAYSGPHAQYGSFGYGVGRGGYGSMALPAQTFVIANHGVGAGIPNVGGYDSTVSGYGVGSAEYGSPAIEQSGVTVAMINDLVSKTKPTGSICWLRVI